jgi:hypothetical protein
MHSKFSSIEAFSMDVAHNNGSFLIGTGDGSVRVMSIQKEKEE